jgi:cation transport ATPase
MYQEDEQSRRKRVEIIRKRNLLILGIVLTLPVVILSMFFPNRFPGENYLLLALATPVWAVVGWEFHRGALKTLRHGSANMDTLISVGSSKHTMSLQKVWLGVSPGSHQDPAPRQCQHGYAHFRWLDRCLPHECCRDVLPAGGRFHHLL